MHTPINNTTQSWKTDKLFRLADLITSGGTPQSGNESYYDGNIFWVQSGDLNDGYITETEKKITEEAIANSSAKIFPEGTFLVAMYGATIGKLGILNMEAATNQACCAIVPSCKLHTKFLYYYFLAIKDDLIRDGYGGGQSNISQSIIKQLYLRYPTKDEQKSISNYLDKACADIDKVIKLKEKQIEKLDAYEASKIRELISYCNIKVETKDSKIIFIGKVPSHWKVDRLKFYVSKIGSGVTPKGGAATYVDEGVPLIRSQNVYDDGLRLDDVSFITKDVHQDMSNSQLQRDDVLLNITGASIGRCCIYELDGEANVNQHVCIIRPTNKVRSRFLHCLLISEVGQSQIFSGFTGSSREGLNFQEIKNFKIFIPPLHEQDDIIAKIEEFQSKSRKNKKIIEQQIETLIDYKKSLIHEVVTGKKQVYFEEEITKPLKSKPELTAVL